MSLFEKQFAVLREANPKASAQPFRDGSVAVTVPDIALPKGWSRPETTVRFIAPVGFPQSQPDCFWADSDLRLEGGRMPQNSNMSPMPNDAAQLVWFSWHVQRWAPNSDTLATYLGVIRKRLSQAV